MPAPAPEPDLGDVPIDFRDYRFSVREAAEMSGVPEETIRNWDKRGQLSIGKRIVFRRVRLCLADAITLHVMFYLSVRLNIALGVAAKVSAYAGEMACLSGAPLGNSIVLGFGDDGEVLVGTAFIREPGHYFPPSFEQDAAHALRKPHVVVPVDAITRNVMERSRAFAAAQPEQPKTEKTEATHG